MRPSILEKDREQLTKPFVRVWGVFLSQSQLVRQSRGITKGNRNQIYTVSKRIP